MRGRWILLLFASACGGGSDATTDSAAPDTVTVSYAGPPLAFAAYRDGQGPWLAPQLVGPATYTLHVTADYQLVVTCIGIDLFGNSLTTSMLLEYTLADGPELSVTCDGAPPPPATVHVTGTMIQQGTVSILDTSQSSHGTAPWSYAFDVPVGTYDLYASDDDNFRAVLRHDQVVTADTSEPVIDSRTSEGQGLVFDVLDIAEDPSLAIALTLSTPNGTHAVVWSSDSGLLEVPPSSMLDAGDELAVDLFSLEKAGSMQSSERESRTPYAHGGTYALPPVLTRVTFQGDGSTVVGTWAELPHFDDVMLATYGDSGGDVVQYVIASSHWIAGQSADHVSFDVAPPGLQPEWMIPAGTATYTSMMAELHDGKAYSSTAILEDDPVSERRDVHRRPRRDRALTRYSVPGDAGLH